MSTIWKVLRFQISRPGYLRGIQAQQIHSISMDQANPDSHSNDTNGSGSSTTPVQSTISSEMPTKNISRLRERHMALAEGMLPTVSYEWEKERWAKRERFGRYGLASGVNLSELWPTVEEIEEENALGLYQKYNDALKKSQKAQEDAKAAVNARLEELAKNEANYENVLKKYEELSVKVEKEKSEREKQMEQRIREIQEHFGYWIDPKDPRFEVMLAQKEAEEKKAKKMARRQAAQQKTIAAVVGGGGSDAGRGK